MTDPMLTAVDPDEAELDRLRERLVREAGRTGQLDLVYATTSSPVGTLLLVASEEGLVRVAFDCEDHDRVLASLAERVGPRILRSPDRLSGTLSQLEAYFAGTLRRFSLPLDLRLARGGFRRTVLGHLVDIDFGRTESYAEVALASGSPRAVRAVGTACATNPLPVVVPCHRVVRTDGTVGQYLGGPEAKRALLDHESRVAAGS